MSFRRTAGRTIVTGALAVTGVVVPVLSRAGATGVPPGAWAFYTSSMAVSPGSQVALHWRGSAGEDQFFILSSVTPTMLPNFDSSAGVTWPTGSRANWDGALSGWVSTAREVTVSIPAAAALGSIYKLQLNTCSLESKLCSNSPGGAGGALVALTVVANWSTIPYESDFASATGIAETTGTPLDVALSPNDSIWNTSEFSAGIGGVPSASSGSVSFADPSNVIARPFAECFGRGCASNATSALSEQLTVVNGMTWFTEGGWLFDSDGAVPNHSEVVAFDPGTEAFCTYVVPGNNNEVTGLVVTGSGSQSRIWFTETNVVSGKPSLDTFSPALIGGGCTGKTSETYSLSGHVGIIAWPANDFPAQIAVDPNTAALWVTDYMSSEVDRVSLKTDQITRYYLSNSVNAYSPHGASPWQIVVDEDYVYAIDYGDDNLVRIDKATGHIDEVALPVTSDTEEGYGLALSGGKLYFTLADDPQPAAGAASTFGYVDVATWEAASASCPPGKDCAPSPSQAVVYTGLPAALSDQTADFRGIAVGADGTVAIADLHQVIRLIP